jgi:hypothetical protein
LLLLEISNKYVLYRDDKSLWMIDTTDCNKKKKDFTYNNQKGVAYYEKDRNTINRSVFYCYMVRSGNGKISCQTH